MNLHVPGGLGFSKLRIFTRGMRSRGCEIRIFTHKIYKSAWTANGGFGSSFEVSLLKEEAQGCGPALGRAATAVWWYNKVLNAQENPYRW